MIFLLTLWSGALSAKERAMLFDPVKNNIRITSDATTYDFTNRTHFKIADQRFYYKDFKLEETKLRLRSGRSSDPSHNYHRIISLDWPAKISNGGELQFVTPIQGRELYSIDITTKAQELWLTTPQRIKGSLQHVFGRSKLEYHGPMINPEDTTFGIYPVPKKLQKVIGKTFRFCILNKEDSSAIRVCSPYYRLSSNGEFQYIPPREPEDPVFRMNSRKVRPRGQLKFKEEKIHFQARLPNGFEIELKGEALGSKVAQVVSDGDDLEVIGYGPKPKSAHTYEDQYRIFETLGWLDTIAPKKFYWKMVVDREEPVIPVLTTGLDFFGQRFLTNEFPEKKQVVYLEDSPRSTYKKEVAIKGRCQDECNLKVKETDERIQIDGNRFTWFAKLKEANKSLQKELLVVDSSSGREWVAQHEVYRGTATELSGRFSVLATLDATISVLQEVSFQHWFESVLGWQNQLLSKQRWGIAVKHFRTISDIVIATGFQPLEWTTTTADIKYRLAPGVWGIDESVGLIGSYQVFTLGQETVPLVGGGAFWAKSMPKIFDNLINWIPYMDYPKWVDTEFIIYPVSLDAKNIPQVMWAINFHGKVLWSENFFGEAGFGMRSVDFIGGQTGLQFQYLTAYITLGLGAQF